jgi:hypothetical protein
VDEAQLLSEQNAEARNHENVMGQGDDGTEGKGELIADEQVKEDEDQRDSESD